MEIDAPTASKRAIEPVRTFLLAHTREKDLDLFLDISNAEEIAELTDIPLTALLPAYMISELRKAFEIGFMIYLPFLVIDLVISSMLISMGMIVLPPMMISLPFKLMLFVLLDGWSLVVGSLVSGLQ
jgi:flagellar biosynthetic protein FliP